MKPRLGQLRERDFERALLDAARSDPTGPLPDAAWARFTSFTAAQEIANSSPRSADPKLPKPSAENTGASMATAPAAVPKVFALAAVAALGIAGTNLALLWPSAPNVPAATALLAATALPAPTNVTALPSAVTAAIPAPSAQPSIVHSAATPEPPRPMETPRLEASSARVSADNTLPRSLSVPRTVGKGQRPSLADEVRLLDASRQALSSGNAARAESLIAEHRRLFPRGALATDIAYLEVEVAHAQGRTADVQRLATAFLTRHPRDAHAARVRQLVER